MTPVDFDLQIAAISAAVPKTSKHMMFERQLADLEAEISEHRATAAKEAAENREDRAGAARKLANEALKKHGETMNAARDCRADFYTRRAAALAPVWQRAVDHVGRVLDAAPTLSWAEIVPQIKPAVDAANRCGRAMALWGPRARILFDITDENRLRSFVSRHRSAR